MLVIRRRPGESFLVGEDVEIEVLDASPSQVKLGIRAPRSVVIVRKEIHLTRAQNLEASKSSEAAAVGRLLNSLKSPAPPSDKGREGKSGKGFPE